MEESAKKMAFKRTYSESIVKKWKNIFLETLPYNLNKLLEQQFQIKQ